VPQFCELIIVYRHPRLILHLMIDADDNRSREICVLVPEKSESGQV